MQIGTVDGNLKSYNADTRAMEFFGPITSANVASVHENTVLTLTNAQVLALPTTPVNIIAAPGAGFVIQVIRATGVLDASAGAYTNVDAAAAAFFAYGGNTPKASNAALLTGTATVAQDSIFLWGGAGVSTAVLVTNGAIAGLLSNYENVAIDLAVDNNAMGVFTGGNAANTLKISIDYLIIPLA